MNAVFSSWGSAARLPRALLAAGVAALSSLSAAAADQPATVIVTAARTPQLLTDTLPHTTVLLRRDIEQSQAVDLPSLQLSALEGCVAMAVSSGAAGVEAAVLLTGAGPQPDHPPAPRS